MRWCSRERGGPGRAGRGSTAGPTAGRAGTFTGVLWPGSLESPRRFSMVKDFFLCSDRAGEGGERAGGLAR